MLLNTRTLLRLHIEAVWGIQLPSIDQNDIELLSTGRQPGWALYVADLNSERIAIWRPDVAPTERQELLTRINEALKASSTLNIDPQIDREVAFHYTDPPTISITTAQEIARRLSSEDQELIKAFDPDAYADFFHRETQPFIGVIKDGKLLSVAHSSRRTVEACELGILTHPEARRKGYALAATIVWTRAILQEKLVPIYSADASNTASLQLANAAGYQAFARGASIND